MVQLYQKGMSKEAWPALQVSSDEGLLAHMVNNTVNVYNTRNFVQGTCSYFNSTLCLELRCPPKLQAQHLSKLSQVKGLLESPVLH